MLSSELLYELIDEILHRPSIDPNAIFYLELLIAIVSN